MASFSPQVKVQIHCTTTAPSDPSICTRSRYVALTTTRCREACEQTSEIEALFHQLVEGGPFIPPDLKEGVLAMHKNELIPNNVSPVCLSFSAKRLQPPLESHVEASKVDAGVTFGLLLLDRETAEPRRTHGPPVQSEKYRLTTYPVTLTSQNFKLLEDPNSELKFIISLDKDPPSLEASIITKEICTT